SNYVVTTPGEVGQYEKSVFHFRLHEWCSSQGMKTPSRRFVSKIVVSSESSGRLYLFSSQLKRQT
ncbi:MAG: hypothetical protein MUO77_03235, partial [Anaerolineales bacterium]|nr:hypothetical protein [Anaerolineales bacterium]